MSEGVASLPYKEVSLDLKQNICEIKSIVFLKNIQYRYKFLTDMFGDKYVEKKKGVEGREYFVISSNEVRAHASEDSVFIVYADGSSHLQDRHYIDKDVLYLILRKL